MIGSHTVSLIPDPDVAAWGTVINTNPYMTTNIAGWGQMPFTPAWVWQAPGVAAMTDPGGGQFTRDPAAPILRGASTLFRLRIRFTVAKAGIITAGFYYGRTPDAASYGPFWTSAADATIAEQQFNCPTAGTYLFEMTHDPVDVNPAFLYIGGHIWFQAAQFPTVDSVEMNGQGVESIDITCLVDAVTINHGRSDSASQPDASSCTLDISLDVGEDEYPAALDVGGIIRVNTSLPAGIQSTRFVGRVTDITQGWAEAGAETPDNVTTQVIATGALAELGRRVVGDTPWPQQLDGARVAAIMAAAGVTLDPATSDPGTVQLLARDVDSQAALDVAQSAANSAGGLVWATRAGDIRYADADHRRGATPTLTLDACDILVTPTWRRTSEGLINSVSIGYGVAPDGGEQPRFVAERADSIEAFGEFGFTSTTELAALADATAMGNLLLTRNRVPVWVMSELPVYVPDLTPEETAALLTLDVSDLITLTGLPSAGAPTSALLWVEGWSETLTFGTHDLSLVVSGYCRTSPAPRWNDINPAMTWDTVSPPSLTWDDATCLGPMPNLGRWDDVPASLRWNGIPPAVTWDTWDAYAQG